MNRPGKILIYIFIGIFGVLPVLGYYFFYSLSSDAQVATFRSSSLLEQNAAVLTAFIVKPIYMLLALIVAILLWKKSQLELKSLKWSMVFFFSGESFCAVNYLFTENHDAHLFEYLHGFGMVLSFGFAAYALFEWVDRYALHYSASEKKCHLSGFCRQCVKFENVSCGLRSVFVYLGLAGAVVALMPLSTQLYTVSYNTEIWGTAYNYNHPVVYQLAEVRYYPVLASVMFLTAALLLKLKRRNPLHPSKILFAGAIGTFGFSLFRLIVFQAYRDNLVWMDFWEETTEFIYILGIIAILWYFRRSLFGEALKPKSSALQ
ncbi:MAG: hypothetical protein HKO68_06140 [Desulfobacterales bacterium]|nr:hypothetical protein [Desulfobacterales bacterium]